MKYNKNKPLYVRCGADVSLYGGPVYIPATRELILAGALLYQRKYDPEHRPEDYDRVEYPFDSQEHTQDQPKVSYKSDQKTNHKSDHKTDQKSDSALDGTDSQFYAHVLLKLREIEEIIGSIQTYYTSPITDIENMVDDLTFVIRKRLMKRDE